MEFTALNEEELVDKVYQELEGKFAAGFRVGLIGDLGAGKTALVRGILKKLGIEEPVTSPTFTLRKVYQLSNGLQIQHIDLYRHQEGARSFEIEEWLGEKDYLSFVEWPENLSNFSAFFDVLIKLKSTGVTEREVELIWN